MHATTHTTPTQALAIAELHLRITRLALYRQQAWHRAMTRTRRTRRHADEDLTQWHRHGVALASARAQLSRLQES